MRTNMPVGSIVYSMLDEQTFQNQIGTDERWVLADGRSVAGLKYGVREGESRLGVAGS